MKVPPRKEKKMEYAGLINSEEMMSGFLSNGRRIYVNLLTVYYNVPEEFRGNPEYWCHRLELGDFEDDENYPLVWIE